MTELKRLFTALEQLGVKEAIGPWLKEPNQAFDGSTPLQVIECGEIERLWRIIFDLDIRRAGLRALSRGSGWNICDAAA